MIVFAGGGTAGHLMPAIAVAEELVEKGIPSHDIIFYSADRDVDHQIIDQSEFRGEFFTGRGFKRTLTLGSLAWNVMALYELTTGVFRSLTKLKRDRPAVVAIVGGYAAAPTGIASAILRIPRVVIQVDAAPGIVNRIMARGAKVSPVPSLTISLAHSEVTGVPVRRSIAHLDNSPTARIDARKKLDIPPERKLILVLGGSLGAQKINDAVFELREKWKDRSDLAIRHVIGKNRWKNEYTKLALKDKQGLIYQPIEFDDDIVLDYTAADRVVARAGAVTVAELTAVDIPSVLVPLPNSPRNHQRLNAELLASTGRAVLLDDDDCQSDSLIQAIESLDLTKQHAPAKESPSPTSAERVAQLIMQVGHRD